MLPKFYFYNENEQEVSVRKFADSADISNLGAIPCGTIVNIELTVSRRLGASGAVLRISPDGAKDIDIPLEFCRSDHLSEVYSCELDTAKLCGKEGFGLFYYEFLLLRGMETLFTDTYNNLDFILSEKEGSRFRLLVYEKDFAPPKKFGKGVIYQIFTDRFFKGDGKQAKSIKVKDGAILNPDWKNGVPQYAPYPGAPLKNNMFFGGTLWGVAEKLDYLVSLGVTYIYLCPIFEAYSNHKYDTSDYTKIDAMFGGEEAFDNLIAEAKKRGIGIILDGVFNHTGDDSIYFNRYKKYGDGGAYNDPTSLYRDWYNFKEYPDKYECWWGIDILPKLNHASESCRKYFTGENGIVQRYIDRGIEGWRLDVADELSNDFLDELRVSVKKASNNEAVIIGEVWENAADKVAYGKRRRYFSGKQLDSVMNYPLKNAIVAFCLWGDGELLYNTLTELYSSYPVSVSNKLMNLLGTHDTERILTVLGRDEDEEELDNKEKTSKRLTREQRAYGIRLLRIAAILQFTAFGIPSVYYGDEVGLEGYGDPFCRLPMPWHETDKGYRAEILDFYRALGMIRNNESALDGGNFYVIRHDQSSVVYVREKGDSRIIVAANRGPAFELQIPREAVYRDLLSGNDYREMVTILKDSAMILKEC